MKYLTVLLLMNVAVFADVSHLKLNTERHYLPAERTVVHDDHQYHRHIGDEYQYAVSKPKAIPDPPSVVVPRSGLNSFVGESPLRQQQLFIPAGEIDGTLVDSNQAQGSDHVVYATAPNSVFHTQINVQSQGSEFNVPKSDLDYVDSEESRRTIDGAGLRSGNFANNPNFNSDKAHGRSINSNVRKQHEYEYNQVRIYNGEQHTPKTYYEDYNKRTSHLHQPEHSRSLGKSYVRTRTDVHRYEKRPNYQGLNLINGNIAADQAALLSRPPTNLNGNIQGINILNGNLLGKHERSSQLGYKYKQYDHEHEKPRTNVHKTEDVYREYARSHHELHDDHSRKADEHSPRHYDDHREYDYHKIGNEQYNGNRNDHHERKHVEYDQYERNHATYKNEDHHNLYNEHETERRHEHHDHHEQRAHHEQREHDNHHEYQNQRAYNDQREYYDHDHPEHHDQREYYEHHDQRQHLDNDHREHYDQRGYHGHDRREHYERREYTGKSQQHSRQYEHDYDQSYRNKHDFNHQRSYESQRYNNDLHEKPKYQQSIVSKPAIKIIAFNNNNQPHLQVAPLEGQASSIPTNNEHLEEFDPSASAPKIVYKPGDEVQYVAHDGTDLRADGYHYGKPRPSFDS